MVIFSEYKEGKYRVQGHSLTKFKDFKEIVAGLPDDIEVDGYGKGKVINEFEDRVRDLLGMEAARFYPSGTMAQQNILRVYSDIKKNKRIGLHPTAHLITREEDGLVMIHGAEIEKLGTEERVFTLEDIKNLENRCSTVLIELPARDLGGDLPEWDELVAMSEYLKKEGIFFHLDGARLWEVAPYYGKSLKEIVALFDSAYVSLYKGIGGVTGAVLLGKKDIIDECIKWQRRYGGNLVSMYPFVLLADHYLEERVAKMGDYYKGAIELTKRYSEIEKAETLPKVVKSNMFHLIIKEEIEKIRRVCDMIFEKHSLSLFNYLIKTDKGYMVEISIGDLFLNIPKEILDDAFEILKREL